ncbi:MAG: carboxypeptidase regulatory-like domain-containing protein [Cyanobacteria bacterium P01_H01_bin.121]
MLNVLKHIRVPVLAAALSVATVPAVQAHQVETNYGIDLFTSDLSFQSVYSSGEPMADAEVRVYAPTDSEEPWLETETDAEGYFTFLPDESIVGTWRIEIQQDGHMDILDVPVGAAGLEFQNITRQTGTDIHYAEIPAAITWAWVVGGLSALTIMAVRRQRQA